MRQRAIFRKIFVISASITAVFSLVNAQDRIPDKRFPALPQPAVIFTRKWVTSVGGAFSDDQETGRSKAQTESLAALTRQSVIYVYKVEKKKNGLMYQDSAAATFDGTWQWKLDVRKDDSGTWMFANYMAAVLPKPPKVPAGARIESALFYTKTLVKSPEKVTKWVNGLLAQKGKKAMFAEGSRGKLLLRYDFPFETAPVGKETKIVKQFGKGSAKQITYEFSALRDSVVRVYAAFIPYGK